MHRKTPRSRNPYVLFQLTCSLLCISATAQLAQAQSGHDLDVVPYGYDGGTVAQLHRGDFNGDGNWDLLMIQLGGDSESLFSGQHIAGALSDIAMGLLDAAVVPGVIGLEQNALVVDTSGAVRELAWPQDPARPLAPVAVELTSFPLQLGGARRIAAMQTPTGIFGALASSTEVQSFTRPAGGVPVPGTPATAPLSDPASGQLVVGTFLADGSGPHVAVVCDQDVRVLDAGGTLLYSFPGGAAAEARIAKVHDPVLGHDLLLVVKRVVGSGKFWISCLIEALAEPAVKVSKNVIALETGDVTGDGLEDATLVDVDGTVYTLHNSGAPNPSTPHFSNCSATVHAGPFTGVSGGAGLAVGDFEGDGDVDIIATDELPGFTQSPEDGLRFFRNTTVCVQSLGIGITDRGDPDCLKDGADDPGSVVLPLFLSVPPLDVARTLETTVLFQDPQNPGVLLEGAYEVQLHPLAPIAEGDPLLLEVSLAPDPEACQFYLILQAKDLGPGGETLAAGPPRVYVHTIGNQPLPPDPWTGSFTPPCIVPNIYPDVGAHCGCSDGGGAENGGGVREIPRPDPVPPPGD